VKGHIISILLAIVIITGCDTQSSVPENFKNYFIKYYGGEGNQIGTDLEVVEDGFVVLGTSSSSVGNSVYLVRTNEIGNEIWSVSFGGQQAMASALTQDANGNFLIAATNKLSDSDEDIMVFRVTAEGNVTDSLSFGFTGEIEKANDISLTSGGDIIVVGSTTNVDINKPGYQASTDLEDIYSIRLTSSFEPLEEADWRRITGFPGIDRGYNISEKNDGTFVFYGTTDRPPSDSQKDGFNMFLYPASVDGQATSITKLQLFGTIDNEYASQMAQTNDGGFVMIGTSNNGNENDIYLARVRSNNDFLSAGLLNSGKNITGSSILESQSGGLILLGRDIVNNTGDITLIKTTVSGAVLWERSFGNVDNDLPGRVKELDDGSIVFVGTIELESQTKMCLIKTTSKGELKN